MNISKEAMKAAMVRFVNLGAGRELTPSEMALLTDGERHHIARNVRTRLAQELTPMTEQHPGLLGLFAYKEKLDARMGVETDPLVWLTPLFMLVWAIEEQEKLNAQAPAGEMPQPVEA